jgi:PAS domain S-box-containing protein
MSSSAPLTEIAHNELAAQLLLAMPEAVFLVDPGSLSILETNAAAERLTGRSRQDLIGGVLSEIFGTSDGTELSLGVHGSVNASMDQPPQLVQLLPAGDRASPLVVSDSVLAADGQSIGMVIVRPASVTDVAKCATLTTVAGRPAEILTSDSLKRGRLASFRASRTTSHLKCSDAMLVMFELQNDSNISFELLAAQIHPDDREDAQRQWDELLSAGRAYESQLRIQHADGGLRYLTWVATVDSVEAEYSILVIVSDDTETVRLRSIETQHHVSLAKLEEVFLALEGFAWECESTTGVFTYVSPGVEDLFGYPASDWLGNAEFFPSLIHPEDRDSILSFCKQETNTDADHTMIYRMITADGSIKWFRDIVHLARNDADVVTHIRGLIIDVTDERHLRNQLVQSEDRFRRLFDESPIALLEMDWSDVRSRLQKMVDSGITDLCAWLEENPEEVIQLSRLGRITAVNAGALQMSEASSLDDFQGNVHSIMREDSMAALREHVLFRFNGGRTFESDNVNYTFSGQRVYVHFTVTAAAGSEQTWDRLYSSLSNITLRKHSQL